MMNDNNIVFKEEQKWENMWIPQAVFVLFILGAIGLILQIYSMQKNHPMLASSEGNMIAGLMLVIPILLLVATTQFKQVTEVRNGSLRVYLDPLLDSSAEIKFGDIKSCEVRNLSSSTKTRKATIRFKPKYSPYRERGVYAIKGNKIVELELENGEIIKIGSQRPDELAAAITNGMNYYFNVPSPMSIKEKLDISRHMFFIFRIAFIAIIMGVMLLVKYQNELGLYDILQNI